MNLEQQQMLEREPTPVGALIAASLAMAGNVILSQTPDRREQAREATVRRNVERGRCGTCRKKLYDCRCGG